jgi:hypothetical protein
VVAFAVKHLLPIAGALVFAACAAPEPTARVSSPRYATDEEIVKLQKEARANFERERQGTLPPVGSGPAQERVAVRTTPPPAPSAPAPTRRNWSIAEARYAMQIGKAPSDLTPGERAAARSE